MLHGHASHLHYASVPSSSSNSQIRAYQNNHVLQTNWICIR